MDSLKSVIQESMFYRQRDGNVLRFVLIFIVNVVQKNFLSCFQ